MVPTVDPTGVITFENGPFSLFGNRGVLHRGDALVRSSGGTRWIYCHTDALSDTAELLRPGRVTELFFLDEATALAAGHRPCRRCHGARLAEYFDAWARASRTRRPLAHDVDEVLSAAREAPDGSKRTFTAPDSAGLAFGTMVRAPGHLEPLLVGRGVVHPWRAHGYGIARPLPTGPVEVLTPRPTVLAFGAGFVPEPAHPLRRW